MLKRNKNAHFSKLWSTYSLCLKHPISLSDAVLTLNSNVLSWLVSWLSSAVMKAEGQYATSRKIRLDMGGIFSGSPASIQNVLNFKLQLDFVMSPFFSSSTVVSLDCKDWIFSPAARVYVICSNEKNTDYICFVTWQDNLLCLFYGGVSLRLL